MVNAASTSNQAQFVFADYYSRYQWWESDVVLQGNLNGTPWKVLTPAASDYLAGYFQFQLTPFINGTAPGQWPPVYATGKVYDPNRAAADLLEMWAMALSGRIDVVVGGNTLKRQQYMDNKLKMAQFYRRKARPGVARMQRSDINGGYY